MMHALRSAARSLLKSPAYSLVAVTILLACPELVEGRTSLAEAP